MPEQPTREHTPLMQQYFDIRRDYPDTLLLFQVGDFYELFFDDAKQAAAYLGIALTTRGKNKGEPIPLCGVPIHAKDHYLTKLVKGGFRVAVCDQLEPPRPGALVERGVTQVLTPGTLTDTQLLNEKSASYLLSFFPAKDGWGLLFGELLTAQLFATVTPAGAERVLESELSRFFPDEILLPPTKEGQSFASYFKRCGYATTAVPWDETSDEEQQVLAQWIRTQFKDTVQRSLDDHASLRCALTYFYAYLRRTQNAALNQFTSLQLYNADDFLILDLATQRNLELVKNNQDGSTKSTLFSVVDRAVSPMGSRMIKKWLLRPLVNRKAIEQRQEVVKLFVGESDAVRTIAQLLKQVGDVERVVGRIALGRATQHDYVTLARALVLFPEIRAAVQQYLSCQMGAVIAASIGSFANLAQLLHAAINEEFAKEQVIKDGFDQELDQLRALVGDTHQQMLALERAQQKATGITSLKIRHNNVHGYYIEVTKTNLDRIPETYVRQQSLVGRERFTMPELQTLQQEILTARARIESVERTVYERVKLEVYEQVTALRKAAHALAHLDAFHGFAQVAIDNGYVCPTLNEERTMRVMQSRHPVIEQCADGAFIPNDITLDDEHSFWIVTGPNMGGKSTYLRQVAQITLLAHCGSFVPAQEADIALCDRIFTRIGAGDNLAEGKSTFLVEMEETAAICTQATKRSLVILDEVGRGTSTFDGLAIAQAVVEYLHSTIQARALFATHYQELTRLEETFPGIVCYHAASKKTERGILFLYQMVRGAASGSFGIEVAQLAGLPEGVIDRAKQLLRELGSADTTRAVPATQASSGDVHALTHEVARLKKEREDLRAAIQELEDLPLDELSPRKAFDVVWKVRERMGS